MLLFCFAGVALADKEDDQASPDRKSWVAELEDTVLLCHLSIPGAHDAFTAGIMTAGVTTQSLFVSEMYDKGVRFFDMRVGCWSTKGHLWLYGFHGGFPVGTWFDNSMNDLYDRVKDSNEFVILEVARESGSDYKQTTYEKMVAYFDRHDGNNKVTDKDDFKQYWSDNGKYQRARDILMPFRPDLRVKDVRGRIVYILNDDMGQGEKDLIKKGWKDEYYADYPYISGQPAGPPRMGTFKLWRETTDGKGEVYEVKYTSQNKDGVKNEAEKQTLIENQFEYYNKVMQEHPDTMLWNFNYISAHKPFMLGIEFLSDPREIAGYCNRQSTMFIGNHPDYYYGIVIMDWAAVATGWGYSMTGDALLDAVINSNWRYWKVKPEDRRNHYEVKTSFHGTHE